MLMHGAFVGTRGRPGMRDLLGKVKLCVEVPWQGQAVNQPPFASWRPQKHLLTPFSSPGHLYVWTRAWWSTSLLRESWDSETCSIRLPWTSCITPAPSSGKTPRPLALQLALFAVPVQAQTFLVTGSTNQNFSTAWNYTRFCRQKNLSACCE